MGDVLSPAELLNAYNEGNTISDPTFQLLPAYSAPDYRETVQDAQVKNGTDYNPEIRDFQHRHRQMILAKNLVVPTWKSRVGGSHSTLTPRIRPLPRRWILAQRATKCLSPSPTTRWSA